MLTDLEVSVCWWKNDQVAPLSVSVAAADGMSGRLEGDVSLRILAGKRLKELMSPPVHAVTSLVSTAAVAAFAGWTKTVATLCHYLTQ